MGKVDFPGSPVVENPPSNAEDTGLSLKIPHAATTEPKSYNSREVCVPQ